MASNVRRSRRIKLEMQRNAEKPPTGVILWTEDNNNDNDDLSEFSAVIIGPDDSPFEGGIFHVSIHIPERYPFVPPRVVFQTPLYHPNIDSGGRICLNVLKQSSQNGEGIWKPSNTIVMVLMMIRLLLGSPNPGDPLMPDIAEEYKKNREIYNQKARLSAQKTKKSPLVPPQSPKNPTHSTKNPPLNPIQSPKNPKNPTHSPEKTKNPIQSHQMSQVPTYRAKEFLAKVKDKAKDKSKDRTTQPTPTPTTPKHPTSTPTTPKHPTPTPTTLKHPTPTTPKHPTPTTPKHPTSTPTTPKHPTPTPSTPKHPTLTPTTPKHPTPKHPIQKTDMNSVNKVNPCEVKPKVAKRSATCSNAPDETKAKKMHMFKDHVIIID